MDFGEKQESGDSIYYEIFPENVLIDSNNFKQWEHINNGGGDKLSLVIEALGVGNRKTREYFVNKIGEWERAELERKFSRKANSTSLK